MGDYLAEQRVIEKAESDFNDMINQSNNMKISNGDPKSEQLEAAIVKLAMKLADVESDMIALEASYDIMCAANEELKKSEAQLKAKLDIAKKALKEIGE
jgi:hypothetical protein